MKTNITIFLVTFGIGTAVIVSALAQSTPSTRALPAIALDTNALPSSVRVVGSTSAVFGNSVQRPNNKLKLVLERSINAAGSNDPELVEASSIQVRAAALEAKPNVIVSILAGHTTELPLDTLPSQAILELQSAMRIAPDAIQVGGQLAAAYEEAASIEAKTALAGTRQPYMWSKLAENAVARGEENFAKFMVKALGYVDDKSTGVALLSLVGKPGFTDEAISESITTWARNEQMQSLIDRSRTIPGLSEDWMTSSKPKQRAILAQAIATALPAQTAVGQLKGLIAIEPDITTRSFMTNLHQKIR